MVQANDQPSQEVMASLIPNASSGGMYPSVQTAPALIVDWILCHKSLYLPCPKLHTLVR